MMGRVLTLQKFPLAVVDSSTDNQTKLRARPEDGNPVWG